MFKKKMYMVYMNDRMDDRIHNIMNSDNLLLQNMRYSFKAVRKLMERFLCFRHKQSLNAKIAYIELLGTFLVVYNRNFLSTSSTILSKIFYNY